MSLYRLGNGHPLHLPFIHFVVYRQHYLSFSHFKDAFSEMSETISVQVTYYLLVPIQPYKEDVLWVPAVAMGKDILRTKSHDHNKVDAHAPAIVIQTVELGLSQAPALSWVLFPIIYTWSPITILSS
jgi:hypothetical protein